MNSQGVVGGARNEVEVTLTAREPEPLESRRSASDIKAAAGRRRTKCTPQKSLPPHSGNEDGQQNGGPKLLGVSFSAGGFYAVLDSLPLIQTERCVALHQLAVHSEESLGVSR